MTLIKFGGILMLLVLAVMSLPTMFELTNHLGEVRAGTEETRLQIWQRLETNLRRKNKTDGTEWYAASCMLAEVRTEGSNRLGKPNPHFKLAGCKSDVCDYAIIGVVYDEPAIVTTRAGVPYPVFVKDTRRDLCITIPVDDVLAVLDGRMPVQ